MADLNSSEIRQRTSDMREWIFEAVDKIGAPMQYIEKEVKFEICEHQVPIPSDLQVLDGVAYSLSEDGKFLPMSKSTKIFKQPDHKEHETCPHQPMNYKVITAQGQFYTAQDPHIKDAGLREHEQYEYFIKPGWIVTNTNKGFVKLAYKAIATDERGYPLIPDTSSYQEAVYWYVVMKLTFPQFISGNLGGSSKYAQKYAAQNYFYVQQQWNFYRNQAYAEAMMPTADDIRNIKNDWHKLIPDWESDMGFFKHQRTKEEIYNDYYYGY